MNNSKINNHDILDNLFKIVVLIILPTLLAGIFLGYYDDPTRLYVDLGLVDKKDPLILITEPDNNSIVHVNSDYFYVKGFASDESGISQVLLRYTLDKDSNKNGKNDMTRFFTVPLNPDGSWSFPIPINVDKNNPISNYATIIVKAEDRRGHFDHDEITLTITKDEPTPVPEPTPVNLETKDVVDKFDGRMNIIENSFSKNILTITGHVDTRELEFDKLEIRYSVNAGSDSKTGFKEVSILERSLNMMNWNYKIEDPVIKENFEIILRIIDSNGKNRSYIYFVDMTNP